MITSALLLTRVDGTTYTIMENSERPNSVVKSLQERADRNPRTASAVQAAVTVQRICTDANGIWVYDNPIKIKVTKTDEAPAKTVVHVDLGSFQYPGTSEAIPDASARPYGLIVQQGLRTKVVPSQTIKVRWNSEVVAHLLAGSAIDLDMPITKVQITNAANEVTRSFDNPSVVVVTTEATPATLKVESV